jgi:hypothetical protein
MATATEVNEVRQEISTWGARLRAAAPESDAFWDAAMNLGRALDRGQAILNQGRPSAVSTTDWQGLVDSHRTQQYSLNAELAEIDRQVTWLEENQGATAGGGIGTPSAVTAGGARTAAGLREGATAGAGAAVGAATDAIFGAGVGETGTVAPASARQTRTVQRTDMTQTEQVQDLAKRSVTVRRGVFGTIGHWLAPAGVPLYRQPWVYIMAAAGLGGIAAIMYYKDEL